MASNLSSKEKTIMIVTIIMIVLGVAWQIYENIKKDNKKTPQEREDAK